MGLVYADIELINAIDLGLAKRYQIGDEEIKRMRVDMSQLQLSIVEKRKGQLANGTVVEYDVAGPIEVRFKNRRCVVDAMVLPGDNEMFLGAIPLEDGRIGAPV